MKKILLILVISLLFVSCNNTTNDETKTDIVDGTTNINIDSPEITTAFLTGSYSEEFHELNLSDQSLVNIPDFEKYLTGSYIYDVWSINLQKNYIEEVDFSRFEFFPNLKEINLSYNNIKDIDISHPFLKILFLHKNNIANISFGENTPLEILNLAYNELNSLKGVKNIPRTIKTLELQHNNLNNLEGIDKINFLVEIKFEFNNLEDNDMSTLLELKNLKSISYGRNKLSEDVENGLNKFNESFQK